MHSHHTGADLSALAAELGLDVTILAARAHQLAAESHTARPAAPDRIGRHRRMVDGQPTAPADAGHLPRTEAPPPQPPYEPHATWASSGHPAAWAAPQDPYASWTPQESHAAWSPPPPPVAPAPTWDPSAVTVAQHDWDGILSQWEAASAPYTFSPGQQFP
ncbi:hypothetical protein [Streptomyces noursei]|uniref:Uncharacterized protein n=1 Tax=Streptomyces noursei TaxID=1971 RepID=A0A2N8PJ06_STRNR|nr:hypothetical protein [Streptomyces noursei]PNE40996.1 hypothetical protein AOB60_09615 [Streptomyces noursei]